MTFKNNVTRFLDSQNIDYNVYTYNYDAGVHSAVDVAESLGQSPAQVFKTLVAVSAAGDHKPALVMIPGPDTLDLKKLAKAIGVKKMQMASRAQAEEMTGLLAGGISPLALVNRGFDIYLDEQAEDCERITISAGERGAQIELPVSELIRLTGARLIALGG